MASSEVLQQVDPKFLALQNQEPLPEDEDLSDDEDNQLSDEENVAHEPTSSSSLSDIKFPVPSDQILDEFAERYCKLRQKQEEEGDDSEEEEVVTRKKRNRKSRSRSRSRSQSISRNVSKVKCSTLKRADPSAISADSTVAFGGKRRSGKSEAMKNVLRAKNSPRIVVFGKGRDWESWQKTVPRIYIYGSFEENLFAALMKNQEQLLALKQQPGNEHLNIQLVIILEDFSSDPKVMRSKAIADLVSNGRRLHTMFLCSAQYLKSLRPEVRTQFDYYFLFQEKNADVRKHLYEAVGAYFESKEEFFRLLDATTKERRCMVINNNSDKTENVEDFTQFFKARIYEPRLLTCFLSRVFHELYFQEEKVKPDRDLAARLEEEARKEELQKSELQKAKVVLQIADPHLIPTEELENQASKKGVFEVVATSGKLGTHLISFSD